MFKPLDYLAGYWTGTSLGQNAVTEHLKARRLHVRKCYELDLCLSMRHWREKSVQKVAKTVIGRCQIQYALQLDDCRELILFQFIRDAEEEVVDAVDKIIEVVDNGWGTGRRNESFINRSRRASGGAGVELRGTPLPSTSSDSAKTRVAAPSALNA